jgi:hypothetical protein
MTEYTKIGGAYRFPDIQLESLLSRVVNAINMISDGYVFSTRAISSAYAAGTSDHVLLVSTASAGVTITLPNAKEVPFKRYTIKKTTTDGNNVTIATAGGNIDGSATNVFATSRGVRELVSDGVDYWVVS